MTGKPPKPLRRNLEAMPSLAAVVSAGPDDAAGNANVRRRTLPKIHHEVPKGEGKEVVPSTEKKPVKKRITQADLKAIARNERRPSERELKVITRHLALNEIKLIEEYPGYLRQHSDFEYIKQIGSGGFGVVWLADDLRTGERCAVKELKKEFLIGRDLQAFCREISTHILSRDRFVCPFIGYTIEPPFSIITKYMPGGSVKDMCSAMLKAKKSGGPPVVTPTHLTIIAMGLAHAIWKVHQAGVVHRDIKGGNILMDEDGFPMLCDFGVSRQLAENSTLTSKIGTATHMAPEISLGNDYTQKIDVYSYAMVLYEMVRLRAPWRNMTHEEIYENVCNGSRPDLRDYASKSVAALIQRCWDPDPKKRPDMYEVFRKWADGEVYFKGTKSRQVKAVAKQIKEEDEQMMKNPPKHPDPTCDVEMVLQRLKMKLMRTGPLKKTVDARQRRPSIVTNMPDQDAGDEPVYDEGVHMEGIEFPPLTEDYEFLRDDKGPYFMTAIDYWCRRMNYDQFVIFCPQIIPYLIQADDISEEILFRLMKLIKRDPMFVTYMVKNRLFSAFPLQERFDDANFFMLAKLMMVAPECCNSLVFRVLTYFMTKKPEETINLFVYYAKKLEKINDPFPTLDVLLSFARSFLMSPAGTTFIDILFYLVMDYNEFRDARMANIRPILCAFMKSPVKEVAKAAICAACRLLDSEFALPIKTLLSYLVIPELRDVSLSLLKIMPSYPIAKEFVESICSGEMTESSYIVLLKFATQEEGAPRVLAKTGCWMNVKDKSLIGVAFRLFLYVFINPGLREQLVAREQFPRMASTVVMAKNVELLQALAVVMRRIEITDALIHHFHAVGFYAALSSAAQSSNALVQGTFLIMEQLFKSGFSSGYVTFLPLLFEILPLQSNLTVVAINMIVVLSARSELRQYFNNPVVINYFKQLAKTSHREQSVAFFANIGQTLTE